MLLVNDAEAARMIFVFNVQWRPCKFFWLHSLLHPLNQSLVPATTDILMRLYLRLFLLLLLLLWSEHGYFQIPRFCVFWNLSPPHSSVLIGFLFACRHRNSSLRMKHVVISA